MLHEFFISLIIVFAWRYNEQVLSMGQCLKFGLGPRRLSDNSTYFTITSNGLPTVKWVRTVSPYNFIIITLIYPLSKLPPYQLLQ